MPDNVEDRLQQLEVTLAHLQRLHEQLNEVVTQQSLEADRSARRIVQLETAVKELKHKQQSQEPFDPLDEKPPHY